jgi:hypothetical protein
MIRNIYRKLKGWIKPSSQIYRIRQEFIDSIDINKKKLEIGPFCSPKCVGSNVKYFDILNTEELKQRAESLNFSKAQIENTPEIHYVSKTGDLSIIDEKFDIIMSSHLIEHQRDLIDHLNQVEGLMNPGGKYYLIIPDKRYCFDHFQNASTIADVLQANIDKKLKHSLKSVVEHYALTTHNEPKKHWCGDHGYTSIESNKIKQAINEFKTKEYIDVHSWYFTPETFENLLCQLKEIGTIKLSINKIILTPKNSGEFYVELRRYENQ